MDLVNSQIFWWIAALVVGVIASVVIYRWLRKVTSAGGASSPVTNSYRLTALPAYRRRVNRYRVYLSGGLLVILSTVVALSIVAARPVESTLHSPDKYNRDIVLCLDISGSMDYYNQQILTQFIDMVGEFEGERIGLVLWNSSASQIFPLTDDYAFVTEQLTLVRDSITDYGSGTGYLFWIGTDLGEGLSLIGDGLASCTMRFDLLDEERSRSIIFATDNFLNGEPLVLLEEAAALARAADIQVYGIEANEWGEGPVTEEYRTAMQDSGHRHFMISNPNLVTEIVTRVQSDQASHYKAPAQWIHHDEPTPWILLLVLGFLGYLALVWRVKL